MIQIARRKEHWTVHCPAKINTFFEILGKRPDGYHEIATVMYAVNFFDTIRISPASGETILSVSYSRGYRYPISNQRQNLVWRAAKLMKRQFRLRGGMRILLRKRIPNGSGLGGGSSDCAGVIAGINQMYKLDLSTDQLSKIGALLGSDVPFFFHSSPGLCLGRGEIVHPLGVRSKLYGFIVVPHDRYESAGAYNRVSSSDLKTRRRDPLRYVNTFEKQSRGGGRLALFNRFEQIAIRYEKSARKMRTIMRHNPSFTGGMTGSGSAWFALFHSDTESRQYAEYVKQLQVGSVYCIQTLEQKNKK